MTVTSSRLLLDATAQSSCGLHACVLFNHNENGFHAWFLTGKQYEHNAVQAFHYKCRWTEYSLVDFY